MAHPAGIVIPFPATSAPSGYLACDGSSLLRASYPDLFSAIGTAYGAADADHFTLPNPKGKVIIGKGSSPYDTLGNTGGAKTIDLYHRHTANSHTHTASGTTSTPSTQHQLGSTDEYHYPPETHTHSWSITTGAQSSTEYSDYQLTSSQSILNPYNTLLWCIKT